MDGQYSIFDCFADLGAPSSYKFERYIGQRVVWHGVHGTITEIEPYYTIVHLDNFRVIAATPHDLGPEDNNKHISERRRKYER